MLLARTRGRVAFYHKQFCYLDFLGGLDAIVKAWRHYERLFFQGFPSEILDWQMERCEHDI